MSVYIEENWNRISPEDWNRLVLNNPQGTIYQTWEWNAAALEAYPDGRKPFFVCLKENDWLIAILPLVLSNQKGKKVLRFMAAERSDYCDLIAANPSEEMCEEIFYYLFSLSNRWDVCMIDNLSQQSVLRRYLRNNSRIKKLSFVSSRVESFSLNFSDEKFVEKVLHKRRVLDYRNHLMSSGKYEVFHLNNAAEIKNCLEDFFSQHVKRWSRTSWPSLFLKEENKVFYRYVVDNLGDKHIVLNVLKFNGVVIAYHFGLVFNQTMLWYKPSFDPAYSRKSPGQVLLYEVLQWARNAQLKLFDFGVGKEDYKFRYANSRSINETVRIYQNRNGYLAAYVPFAVKWRLGRIQQKIKHRFMSFGNKD